MFIHTKYCVFFVKMINNNFAIKFSTMIEVIPRKYHGKLVASTCTCSMPLSA